MATYKINGSLLTSIANAIRQQLGTSRYYKPSAFPSAIRQIRNNMNIKSISVSANGVYNISGSVNGFNPVVVNVKNSYSFADEGKVVSNAKLINQLNMNINANGIFNTLSKKQVTVNVPNSYRLSDSGKVVSGSTLVSQTNMSISMNGTYNTTMKKQVTVNVAGGDTDTSDATLSSGSQMLSGVTAYARGRKYTGTIPMYNGSINSGSGSVPTYDYYSGSYVINPLTFDQSFPTAGYIMSQNLQVLSYSGGEPYDGTYEVTPFAMSQILPTAGKVLSQDVIIGSCSIVESYSGSYTVSPSVFSQAFPTAGKMLSEDFVVEGFSLDYYEDEYVINPSTEVITLSTAGKTLTSDIEINACVPSIDPYQGSYVVTPSWLEQTLETEGKTMLENLVIEPYEQPEVYDGDYVITPSTVEQSFPTAGMMMTNDFIVESCNAQVSLVEQTFSENGIYYASNYDADGFSEVAVNVEFESYEGEYVITPMSTSQTFPTAGKMLSDDFVVEATGGTEAILISATLSSNYREYRASDFGADGFSKVAVVVPLNISSFTIVGTGTFHPFDYGFDGFDAISVIAEPDFSTMSFISSSAYENTIGITSLNLDSALYIGESAFTRCLDLSVVNAPVCGDVGSFAFESCTHLYSVYMPSVFNTIAIAQFKDCSVLDTVEFPNCLGIDVQAFEGCVALPSCSFPNVTFVFSSAFKNCSLLSDITFDDAQSVVDLISSNAFEGTPFVQNDSAYARIHVPSSLISNYQADSQWSYFSNCFVPIEEGE